MKDNGMVRADSALYRGSAAALFFLQSVPSAAAAEAAA